MMRHSNTPGATIRPAEGGESCVGAKSTRLIADVRHYSPSQSRRLNSGTVDARPAFTLVELIVVIGIIILLVALTAAVSTALASRGEQQKTESTLNLLQMALDDWRTTADREISWGNNGSIQVNGVTTAQAFDLQMSRPHLMSVSELLCTVGRSPSAKTILAQIPEEQVARFDPGGSGAPGWLSPDPDDPDPNAGATIADFNDLADDFPGVEVLVILDAWGTPIRLIHPGRLRYRGLNVAGAGPPDDPLPDSWPDWTKIGNAPTGQPKEDDGTVFVVDSGSPTGLNGMEEHYGMCRNRKICFVSAGPDGKFGSVNAPVGDLLFEQSRDNVYSYEVIRP